MAKLNNFVLVALAAIIFHAEGSVAEENNHILENRAAYYGGLGLQLQLTDVCPTGTYSCQEQITPGQQVGGPCCPDVTWCVNGTSFCCPTSQDCTSSVSSGFTCADPSWILLSDGGSSDPVCCPSGDGVLSQGECVASSDIGMQWDTAYTTSTQANDASPTGDHSESGGAAAATTTAAGGGSAPSNSPGGSSSRVGASPTVAGGSTPTGAATSASASKKSSADKNFVAGGSVLVGVLAVVLKLL